jgi:hypothetical protein
MADQPQQIPGRPVDEMMQAMSEQAVVLVREQVELARREMTAKARQAGTGAALLGGAGVLGALASGTATAALVLLLSRRPGPSAAAAVVTGAYAGVGAVLAQQGIERLRGASPLVPEETVSNAKKASKRGSQAARGKPQKPRRPAGSKPRRNGRSPSSGR